MIIDIGIANIINAITFFGVIFNLSGNRSLDLSIFFYIFIVCSIGK